jgi:hypothetical protein
MTRPSFRSLRVAVAILGAAALLAASPAAASWSQALNTPSLNLSQGQALSFDLIVTHVVGSPDNTIAVTVTASKIGGSGVTGTGAGPTLLTDANSPLTISLALNASASATLGSWIVNVRSVEGISTRTSTFTINVVAGSGAAAPVISGVSATSTVNSISVSWNTDIGANQRLFWGTNSCPDLAVPCTYNGTPVANTSTFTTSHLMSVSGLLPNTLYYFRVVSCSISNVCSTSNEGSIRTALATGDTAPPTISNILISAGDIRATVTWSTDENADSLVEYGLSTTYGSQVADGALTQSHTVNLTGLTPLTRYYYRITSRDSSGNSSNTGVDPNKFFETVALGQVDRIFTTGACTDGSGNAVPIGQCTVGTPSEYCHSGGILALDCNYCGYTCSAGQTCRADGTCSDNPSANPNNPYQCNDAKCYDVSGVFVSPSPFADCYSTYPKCNANSILKVRPDRICTQWLTPKTSVTLTNPQTKQQEQLSLSLTACTSLDSAGRCATVAEGDHCRLSPLTLCNTDGDCDIGDKCVPATHCADSPYEACTTDAKCPNSTCISDNLTFFNPRDRSKFGFLTGSIQPGLSWGGGYCAVDQDVACGRDSDCPARTPPQSCNFDPIYGRCSLDLASPDYAKACTVNNAETTCGPGKQCFIQEIGGRYPWQLNREVGVAVPQLGNNGFEEIQRVEQNGKTVVQFPASPWQTEGAGSSIRVIVDPALAGTTTAGSNHVLEVSPSTTAGSGAKAPVAGFTTSAQQRYYLSVRMRASGTQRIQLQVGDSNAEIVDLTDSWAERLIPFTPGSSGGGSYLKATCVSTPPDVDCTTNAFYLDDVSIQTALNVATVPADSFHPDGRLIVPRSCRLYPQEDSLVCDYTLNGVRYKGQHGYCLQRDPQNDSICVSWWPVDIIAGDGDFFGTQTTVAAYRDRTPLYMCLESRGLSVGNYEAQTAVFNVYNVDRGSDACDQSAGNSESGCTVGASNCGIKTCLDIGADILGAGPRGMRLREDIYEADIHWIDVIVSTGCPSQWSNSIDPDECDWAGLPSGTPSGAATFRLSRDNNWQFIWCTPNITGQTQCPTSLTFDQADARGWTDGAFNPGNAIGAKASFTSAGFLTTMNFRYADGSPNRGSVTMKVNMKFKELCTKLVKVADGDQTVPWTARLSGRSYQVPNLDYKYTTDYAPFGGVVEPASGDRSDPSTWPAPLNAEAMISSGTGDSQGQARSGTPYACAGRCSEKVCIGGGRNGSVCSNNATICQEPDANGNTGICQGIKTEADGQGAQSVIPNPDTAAGFFAQQRVMRTFAKSLGVYRLGSTCTGASQQASTFCSNDTSCQQFYGPNSRCVYGYVGEIGGGWFSYWDPPTTRCQNDKRPTAFQPDLTQPDTDYCGIPPKVGSVKVNGSIQPITIRSNGLVSLTFTTTADAEQVPIQHILVDWDDSGTPEPLDKTISPQPDPTNPMVFTHTYTCSQGTCTYTPHIKVMDNWGWGSKPGATNRTDSASDITADWVTAPTITVTSN